MSTKSKLVISASMMLVAVNAVASTNGHRIVVPDANVSKELDALIKGALSKKSVNDRISETFNLLAESLVDKDGKTLSERYFEDKGLRVASSSDSTTNGPGYWCYSNCYGNCHGACHGSRGWR